MSKLPAFQFYPGDWMKDPSLRACSFSAKGLLMDVLCLCHESAMRGCLVLPSSKPLEGEQLRRCVGSGIDACEFTKLLAELEENGVLSRHEDGYLYSRRMVREEMFRQTKSASGRMGAKARWQNNGKGDGKPMAEDMANGMANDGSSSSSSSSPSGIKESTNVDSSASPKGATPAGSGFVFATLSGHWELSVRKLDEYQGTYADRLDVAAEMRKAKQWLCDNKSRRKTTRGMTSFLTGWLNRAYDRAPLTMDGSRAAAKPSEDAVYNPETGEFVKPLEGK